MAKCLPCCCLALLIATPASALRAQTALVAPDAGCVPEKGAYTCNLAGLKLALERSRSIAVETPRLDRVAARQLEHFVLDLGKDPSETPSLAELSFSVQPTTPSGVVLGPSDHELASLRVTAPGKEGKPVLLWVETLRGQGDRPWPAQVHALLEQFKAHLTGKH